MIIAAWVAVAVALVATLAACGWMLVRKGIRLLEALAELLAKPAILDGVHLSAAEERPTPAVLEPRSDVAARYHAATLLRRERKRLRTVERLARARRITS